MKLAMKNGPVDFAELIKLEKITDNTFRSTTKAYAPNSNMAYGGHVYAQAVWAAAQTVMPGFLVHVRLILREHLSRCWEKLMTMSARLDRYWLLHASGTE